MELSLTLVCLAVALFVISRLVGIVEWLLRRRR
jgi:hypothetical protein